MVAEIFSLLLFALMVTMQFACVSLEDGLGVAKIALLCAALTGIAKISTRIANMDSILFFTKITSLIRLPSVTNKGGGWGHHFAKYSNLATMTKEHSQPCA